MPQSIATNKQTVWLGVAFVIAVLWGTFSFWLESFGVLVIQVLDKFLGP